MKPRTAAELAAFAAYPGLEESMAAAEYVNYHVQAERNKYTPRHISDQYDNYDANDRKYAEMFPRSERTIWRGGRK